jgi:type IV fimbrial biogenesis protein FimT
MKNRNAGFTLFELMMGMSIMAILVGLAAPTFRDFGRNTRVVATHNDFITAMNLARTEAIRRSTQVSVCASANLTTCSGAAADYATGWIVFTDATGTAGTLDGTDTLLQVWTGPGTTNGITLGATGTNPQWIRFTPTGLLTPSTDTKSYTIRSASCVSGAVLQRQITVNGIGAIRAERIACP